MEVTLHRVVALFSQQSEDPRMLTFAAVTDDNNIVEFTFFHDSSLEITPVEPGQSVWSAASDYVLVDKHD